MKRILYYLIKFLLLSTLILIVFIPKTQGQGLNLNFSETIEVDSIPQVFAPGIVSTEYAEFGITIMPDFPEIYFTRRGEMPNPRAGKIMVMKMVDGNWQKPEIASFSGRYNDMEPLITPDGRKLIFGSNRPLSGNSEPGNFLQWYVEREDNTWSEPNILGPPFDKGFVMYPTVANNGNLYYTAEDGIYVSCFINGFYHNPQKLSDEINFLPRAAHPFISPDESYLIFDAQPRGSMKSDLFISYNENGEWTKATKLSGNINTAETQAIPLISPDEEYFFFVRSGDIYWIRTANIKELNTLPFK